MTDKAPDPKADLSRRNLLGKAGVYAFLGAIGMGTAGLIRSAIPSAMPDPSLNFKIGPPQDYPEGTVKSFDEENVIVFRDDAGMWAISTVCPHLGCIVAHNLDRRRFDCPCHGSSFDSAGNVTQGPSPRPLDWLEIAVLPSGQLTVDKSKPMPVGTKYKV